MKLGRCVAVLFAALLTWSCANSEAPLAPVPTLSLDGVSLRVREAVLAAHAQAEAEPENGQASGRLGMVLQANTLYPQAVLAYERAIQLEPKEFAWQYYLALTLQEQSKLEDAVDILSKALRLRPDYVPAGIKLGELLFELGRFEESAAAVEPLLVRNPPPPEALYILAQVKLSQDHPEEAQDLYRRATLAYPTYGSAYYGLAVTEKRLGQETASGKNFILAERYKGDSPQGEDPLIKQMSDLGVSLFSQIHKAQELIVQGNVNEASRLIQEVLEQDPDNLDGLLNILYVGPVDGQPSPDEMEGFYQRARKIAPDNPQVYMYYGMTLTNYNKVDPAIATLNKAIELKSDYAEAHTLLGSQLEKKNLNAQAIQHYHLALEAQPSFRPAQLQLSRILITLGRFSEAIPVLHSLLEVDDVNTGLTMVALAQAYANTGDTAKAQQYLMLARTRVKRTGPPALLEQIEQALTQMGSRL